MQALVERLAGPDAVPADPAERSAEEHGSWLLAQLLGWHRREDKSMWWDFHHLMDLTPEQLVDEDDPIGLLEPVGPLDEPKNGKQTLALRASRRRTTTSAGASVYDPANKQARPNDSPFNWVVGEGATVDAADRTVDLRRTLDEPHPARHRPAELGPDR